MPPVEEKRWETLNSIKRALADCGASQENLAFLLLYSGRYAIRNPELSKALMGFHVVGHNNLYFGLWDIALFWILTRRRTCTVVGYQNFQRWLRHDIIRINRRNKDSWNLKKGPQFSSYAQLSLGFDSFSRPFINKAHELSIERPSKEMVSARMDRAIVKLRQSYRGIISSRDLGEQARFDYYRMLNRAVNSKTKPMQLRYAERAFYARSKKEFAPPYQSPLERLLDFETYPIIPEESCYNQ